MSHAGRSENLGRVLRIAPRAYAAGDYAEVCGWYLGHGETPPLAEFLPGTGRIVPEVAAGFLYRTDAAIGFIDGFIGNPDAPAAEVAEALEKILLSLEDAARRLGMKVIYGNTRNASITRIARRLGAVVDEGKPYATIAKVI